MESVMVSLINSDNATFQAYYKLIETLVFMIEHFYYYYYFFGLVA